MCIVVVFHCYQTILTVSLAKIKVSELRTKKKNELLKQLEELRTELAALRVAQVTGGAPSKLAKMHPIVCVFCYNSVLKSSFPSFLWDHGFSLTMHSKLVRKSVAQVLTVINQTRKFQLREFYKGKKYKPLDLRAKKTKAKRLELTKAQRRIRTPRLIKRRKEWPRRLYAVRA